MNHADHDQHAVQEQHSGHDQHSGHEHHGHHDHSHHVQMYGRLFWIMLALGVPTVAFSPMFANLLGYEVTGWGLWVAPALGTLMYFWGGKPFLEGGRDEIRERQPGMMLLISLGITVAFLASWGATIGLLGPELEFWWELALLVVIMLLGHWVEMRSLAQTGSALDSLASLLPDQAERVVGDQVETVDPSELKNDDEVIIRPGDSVPADGVITQGSASMDESMITGESRSVRRGEGDQVVAGTVATDSGVRIRVTAVGDDTALAGIRRLVDEAQNSSSRAQRIADRAAAWLFWYALGAAVLTALAWWLLGTPEEIVARVITVLVIACPHALGLAIPLVVSIATERAARRGVLITDRLALEGMRTVDVVLFDKTGTLTKGSPAVTGVQSAEGWVDDDVVLLVAAAESDSEHPLARAIVAAAAERELSLPASSDFSSSPAVGVEARVDGQFVQVGGPYLLEQEGVSELESDHLEQWRDEGATVLHVLVDRQVVGALRLVDEVRPESAAAVAALHDRGVEVHMITGDAEAVAASVSEELGIDNYSAGVRPEDKASAVRRLQDDGRRVAMVGDGVNDAPALAQADVGIAIGAGTDVAIASAGVVLAADDPRAVVSVAVLSEATYRKMVQNLWWAGGYNLLAVPLAAGVLAPIGLILPMSVGAVLMSLSTVVVAANAQLLRRLDLSPEAVASGASGQRS
ncbi:heavy metal translocating P-type ATPase [Dietzia alimentaria]|uniref:heavy metal translocating P-type ATPase n=1 Tax=Dietzia alimentaria TaxID=665550 RepID=UPI00029A31B4|nr:heavy metal translocating P-type ATPase [Dietzia alimentaria]